MLGHELLERDEKAGLDGDAARDCGGPVMHESEGIAC
jgi:hypothetical protein